MATKLEKIQAAANNVATAHHNLIDSLTKGQMHEDFSTEISGIQTAGAEIQKALDSEDDPKEAKTPATPAAKV